MRKYLFLLIITGLMLANPAKGQDECGKNPPKSVLETPVAKPDKDAPAEWDFVEYDDFSKNVVQIRSRQVNKSTGRVGTSGGTGVIIKCDKTQRHPRNENFYRGYILTCDHVVVRENIINGTLEIQFQNGVKISEEAIVVMNHKGHDVSLIRCWIPVEYEGLVISREPLKFGDKVRMAGYGDLPDVKKPRYFESIVYRYSPSLIVVLEDAVPGDSGGAIMNSKGELVGLISRGASAFKKHNGITITSPLHGPATAPMIMIITAHLQTEKLKKDLPVILEK